MKTETLPKYVAIKDLNDFLINWLKSYSSTTNATMETDPYALGFHNGYNACIADLVGEVERWRDI